MTDRRRLPQTAQRGGQRGLQSRRLTPPGGKPGHGPEEIARSEQKDYDVAKWTINVRPLHALQINDDWVYGIAETAITLVAHADGSQKSMTANKGWLLHRQASGEWKIVRAMWNYR